MPVILSDISPHSALVAGRAKFLYPIGNIGELTTRMFAAAEQYDEYAAECVDLARDFSEESFLTDWEGLFAADAAVIL